MGDNCITPGVPRSPPCASPQITPQGWRFIRPLREIFPLPEHKLPQDGMGYVRRREPTTRSASRFSRPLPPAARPCAARPPSRRRACPCRAPSARARAPGRPSAGRCSTGMPRSRSTKLGRRRLLQVEVQVAERAGRDEAVGPGVDRVGQVASRLAQRGGAVHRDHREAAALARARVLDRLGAERLDHLVRGTGRARGTRRSRGARVGRTM